MAKPFKGVLNIDVTESVLDWSCGSSLGGSPRRPTRMPRCAIDSLGGLRVSVTSPGWAQSSLTRGDSPGGAE
jgi:hypothetical protein